MALKLITSEEAARLLGVSLDELNHLREQREISGYRDGSSWKFKEQDIQQLKQRQAEGDSADDGLGFDDLSFSIDADESVDSHEFEFGTTTTAATAEPASPDSQELIELPIEDDNVTDEVVLLSDLELGESGPGTSSTIIGRPGVQSPEESDIRIITDEDSGEVSANASDLALPSDSSSSLALVVDDQFDVSPEADTQLRINPQPASSSGLDLASDVTAGRAGTSDISLGDDSLDMDELVLGSDPSGSSGSKGSKAGESGVALAVEDLDDDELVLGGGSDITLGSADSGISLASPSDSGLSLEEPLALRPVREAPIAKEPLLEDDSDSGSDDDFLLTPMQDAEEQDSGSQIIALDSESSIGADMFSEDAGMGAGMFEDAGDAGMLEGDFGAVSADPLAGAATSASLAAGPVSLSREAPYTVWNVVSLSACAVILALCGLMMFDLVRNMWSWDSPYSLNSSLADTILGIIPGMQ